MSGTHPRRTQPTTTPLGKVFAAGGHLPATRHATPRPLREELNRRATFDELTGCHNRPSIMGALEANIASGQRQAERAVVFVDLNSFNAVNDRYGHATGDEVLNIVGVSERRRS